MKKYQVAIGMFSATCLLAACGGGGDPAAVSDSRGVPGSDVPLSSAEVRQIIDIAEAGYTQVNTLAPLLVTRLPELIDKYLPLLAQIPAGSNVVHSTLLQFLVPGLACDNALAGGSYTVKYNIARNGGLSEGDQLGLNFVNCVVQGVTLDGGVGLTLLNRSADGRQMNLRANLSKLTVADGANVGKLNGTANAALRLGGESGSLDLTADTLTVDVPAGAAAGTYALTGLEANQKFNLDGSGLSSKFAFGLALPKTIAGGQQIAVSTVAPLKGTMAGAVSQALGGAGAASTALAAFDSDSGSVRITGYRGATIRVTPQTSRIVIDVDRDSDGRIDETHAVEGSRLARG